MFRKFLPLAAALLAVVPGAAMAHVKLTASTPTANATVAKPARIELKFSDKLIAPTIKTEVMIIGVSSRIEIWAKDKWQDFLKNNSGQFEELGEKLILDSSSQSSNNPKEG